MHPGLSPSYRRHVLLTGTDTHHAAHITDKNLAVTDLARAGGGSDGLDAGIDQIIGQDDLNLYFWQKINHIFRASIEFGMTLLPTKPLDLDGGHTGDARRGQGLADVIQFEGLDYGLDLFHYDLLLLNLWVTKRPSV
jgi:hypothetical protein